MSMMSRDLVCLNVVRISIKLPILMLCGEVLATRSPLIWNWLSMSRLLNHPALRFCSSRRCSRSLLFFMLRNVVRKVV
eukprot:6165567-Amphidinium_carterae.2